MGEALAGQLSEAVRGLLDAPLSSLPDDALLAELSLLFTATQQLTARVVAEVGEAASRGIPAAHGASGTRAWLAELLSISVRSAAGLTKLAERLPRQPVVAQAWARGALNTEQAQAISALVADLPPEVGSAGKARAEQALTDLAVGQKLRPETLAAHRRSILETVSPEIAEDRLRRELERANRSAYLRRAFTLTPNGEGEYRITGVLDSAAAAYVRAALDPISAPGALGSLLGQPPSADGAGPSGRGAPGSGSAGAIDADGDAATSGGGGPDLDGDAPGLADGGPGLPDGVSGFAGGLSARFADALDDAGRDTRSAAARRADALTFLCAQALADGELPRSGGERPQLVVTLSWEQLREQLGHGLLDTGDLLTPETVRRLACDAQIIPAVLGGDGRVLDVGRARRLIDGSLRRALVLRDRGCAWPGCDRPPRWCEGHHVVSWSDGGPTSLDNSVLLCGHHHREIHRGAWQVRINLSDGRPDFLPPRHLDPLQRPRRNMIHRRT
ncbi:HNH endonuclease signature motif containing protein [Hamadaea tsunoensis]|uniref:HNH endonuclease signature motif containing protein n=1 Tax=Hamadaea tsunoensis TaxID=53368 RepID=UPI00040047A4|nr:HNH endonuclease signature motif containing protein [Hamadaea tsunoensis]